MMHEIEGKPVKDRDKGIIFKHIHPETGKVTLCKLEEVNKDYGNLVAVSFFRDNEWNRPVNVACVNLRWYKEPSFTADDLLK